MLDRVHGIGLWMVWGGFFFLAMGEEPAPLIPGLDTLTNSPLRQISENLFELGGVRFDKVLKTVSFPAGVNMKEGLVEYLVVGKTGKVHESVFQTEVEPVHLHVALLFIGARGAPEDTANSPTSLPDAGSFYAGPKTPSGSLSAPSSFPALKGDPITIWVSWQSPQGGKKVRGETCVWNKKTNAPMTDGDWIYTGSVVANGTFLAQRDRSLVAIIPDVTALINNPRPDRQYDGIWEANPSILPPSGTPVQMTIKLKKNPSSAEQDVSSPGIAGAGK